MVHLSVELDRDELLQALDETPQTADRLARRLDRDPEAVETELERAREDGLAADWGHVWATTWRAKISLAPGFFRVWVPGSIALGAGLTAVAIGLNAPDEVAGPAVLGLGVVALLGALLAGVAHARR